jgi:hypothetical protein
MPLLSSICRAVPSPPPSFAPPSDLRGEVWFASVLLTLARSRNSARVLTSSYSHSIPRPGDRQAPHPRGVTLPGLGFPHPPPASLPSPFTHAMMCIRTKTQHALRRVPGPYEPWVSCWRGMACATRTAKLRRHVNPGRTRPTTGYSLWPALDTTTTASWSRHPPEAGGWMTGQLPHPALARRSPTATD